MTTERPIEAHGPDLAACADAFRIALLARDARQAEAVVEAAVHDGAEIVDIYQHVFEPAMAELGHLWALDEINVAQEHYATEVTSHLLSVLAVDRRVAPTEGRLALVSCSPGEQHVLGSRMVADLLQRCGWEVISLGAATPCDDLVELAASECPDLVALSTATAGRLPGVQDALSKLVRIAPRPFVAVGGGLYTPAVVDVARSWGADLATTDLRAFLRVVGARFPPV